ncbi:MAG: chromosomal replication initiator protein DnaA [Phycisphaerales bacterium]|nr:chromosomal replication initiator protein DnaA [Phycisphaerales bacterium]
MQTHAEERLCQLRDLIQRKIGASRYRTWFGESTALLLHDDGLDIIAASSFACTWIANNYLDELTAAASEVLGRPAVVRVIQAAPPGSPAARPAHAGARKTTRPERTLRYELDSFVVGPGNQLAHSAAQAVVRAPGHAFRLLVLHGPCGLGKTHLLQGVCNALGRSHPSANVRYVSGEEFTNEYIFAVRGGPIDVFRARYRKVDILIVDDIHFLANKKATQDEFLHTYNAVDSAGKLVIVSSDRHPRSIASLSEPLMNRLIAGMIVQIDPPDFQTRRTILRRRAAAQGVTLPDDVLDLLAAQGSNNVRELEGVLYTLTALASLASGPLTAELAQRALDEAAVRSRRTPDAADIERIVSLRFGVTREQIQSRSRDRTVVLARSLAMLLIRRHTALSFPEIARSLGKKNHSTVLMATQRLERQLAMDAKVEWKSAAGAQTAPLKTLVESLEQELAGPRG